MKSCIKCGRRQPLTEYYPHPKMGDGHLNKCKSCAKADADARWKEKMKDPMWADKENTRHRLKQAKARANGTAVVIDSAQKSEINRRYSERHPEKRAAHSIVTNAIKNGSLVSQPCEVCGSKNSEAHHEDYAKPMDVQWLCPKHHADRHIELKREIRWAQSDF